MYFWLPSTETLLFVLDLFARLTIRLSFFSQSRSSFSFDKFRLDELVLFSRMTTMKLIVQRKILKCGTAVERGKKNDECASRTSIEMAMFTRFRVPLECLRFPLIVVVTDSVAEAPTLQTALAPIRFYSYTLIFASQEERRNCSSLNR